MAGEFLKNTIHFVRPLQGRLFWGCLPRAALRWPWASGFCPFRTWRVRLRELVDGEIRVYVWQTAAHSAHGGIRPPGP